METTVLGCLSVKISRFKMHSHQKRKLEVRKLEKSTTKYKDWGSEDGA